MRYYPRNIEKLLKKAARQFRIVVVTGSRQTGKSTLLQHLFKKTHRYVTLDNPRDLNLALEDPELFFQEYNGPLILDEIQYAPQLLKYIKINVDRSNKRGQYLITGSQQFTLMKGLQETLAGRAALFQLFPMSISEGRASTQNYQYRALKGSFPELVTIRSIDAERWFGSYISTYIEKDVQLHYQLEKIALFRNLLFMLAARCSQVLNCQSLANDLGVSVTAIKSWVKILEVSQVIYLLRPYHTNLGSRIVKSPKVYFTDIGLVNYITGNRNKRSLFQGPQSGAIFENYVIQETLKYYSNLGRNAPIFYYRTNNGLEVDLIIEEKLGQIRPYEIKLTKTPHRGMTRALDRLRKLNKKRVKILAGAIISLVSEPFHLTRNVMVYNLEDFIKQI